MDENNGNYSVFRRNIKQTRAIARCTFAIVSVFVSASVSDGSVMESKLKPVLIHRVACRMQTRIWSKYYLSAYACLLAGQTAACGGRPASRETESAVSL